MADKEKKKKGKRKKVRWLPRPFRLGVHPKRQHRIILFEKGDQVFVEGKEYKVVDIGWGTATLEVT